MTTPRIDELFPTMFGLHWKATDSDGSTYRIVYNTKTRRWTCGCGGNSYGFRNRLACIHIARVVVALGAVVIDPREPERGKT